MTYLSSAVRRPCGPFAYIGKLSFWTLVIGAESRVLNSLNYKRVEHQ